MVAANTDWAKTGGTTMPTPVAVMPLTMKSRRVIISFASLELKFGAGEQRVPPVAVALTCVEDGGGVRPDHTIELGLHCCDRVRKARAPRATTADAKFSRASQAPDETHPWLDGQPATVGMS